MTQGTRRAQASERLRGGIAAIRGVRVWAVSGVVVLTVVGGAAALWLLTGTAERPEPTASNVDRPRDRRPPPEPLRLDRLPATEAPRSRTERRTSANAAPVIGVGTDEFAEAPGRQDATVEVDANRPTAEMASTAEVKRNLAALERANARVEAALSNAGGPASGTGELIWPVRGPVTSEFGPRWGRLHAGIDIGVPTGTPVRAADSGRVALSGSVGGYGNYICVQHTRSLTTCYAHNSQLGVRKGESVRKGAVIARAGSTGNSSGPHLHFETRVNGKPVNPRRYL